MSRFSGVVNHSFQVTGSDTPVEVCFYSDFRRYVMLYAQTGTCYFTIGAYDSANEIALTEGNTYEPVIMPRNQIWYRGAGSTMVVVEDLGRMKPYGITYNNMPVYVPGSTENFLQILV